MDEFGGFRTGPAAEVISLNKECFQPSRTGIQSNTSPIASAANYNNIIIWALFDLLKMLLPWLERRWLNKLLFGLRAQHIVGEERRDTHR